MFNLILYAIPFFVATLAAEWWSFSHADDLAALGVGGGREVFAGQRRGPAALVGYEILDTVTSLTMGAGNVIINVGWKLVVTAVYAACYELTPLRLSSRDPWTWVVLFFADDLAFYWYHRVSHEVRVFWASHVVHHSSEHYNLSTALRQPWVPMTSMPFWIPLALIGIPPWMILLEQAISLVYQFGLHTERIGRLPAPIEMIFNTPSHHRAHHGANQIYLDKNYGGILIVWDRLFGSFQAETERVRYGLTRNIDTFNPLRVATHEYAAIVRDVRRAATIGDAFGYVLRGPAWSPASRDVSCAARPAAAPPPDAGMRS